MRDVMVDLETTGTSPEHSGIIQLAAVKFDIRTGEVGDFFDQCLLIPPTRYWDEGTRDWWFQQRADILPELYARMRDTKTVLREFLDWCGGPNALTMWAKPVSFEFPFIASYYRQFELPNPFHYRMAVNCRSFVEGLYFPKDPLLDTDIEFKGTEHNAIYDCLHQVRWMLTAAASKPGLVEILPPEKEAAA